MLYHIEAISDRGRVRANNEDHILVGGEVFTDDHRNWNSAFDLGSRVFAVADGMGGHNAGEIASKMVLQSLHGCLANLNPAVALQEFEDTLVLWLESIHQEMEKAGNEDPGLRGMGTTLTGLFFGDNKIFCFHAGDSRAYRYHNKNLQLLTNDHTLNNNPGMPERRSNMLLNCISAINHPRLDIAEIDHFRGSTYLLCSDGLTDMVPEMKLAELIGSSDAKSLVDEASKNGGRDNITLIYIKPPFNFKT